MEDIKIVPDDDIQTINLDLNAPTTTTTDDSLGIELLADPKKSIKMDGYSSGDDKPVSPKKEFNLFSNDNNINDIGLDDTKPIDFSSEKTTTDNNIKSIGFNDNIKDDPILSQEIKSNDDEFKPIHLLSAQEIKNEKIDLIYKFKRLENQGIKTSMNYNMNSQLEDMRNEYVKLKKQREVENSIKFQRKMLMACITGIEFLNGKFDPFNIKLDGWSESMNEGINDYDEVFEELHEKYGGTTEVAPEIRLIFMVAGSAFMFHLTNTMFKTSLPGMDEVMKNNPELMQGLGNAARQAFNGGNMGPMGGPMGGMPPSMGGLIGDMLGDAFGNKASRLRQQQSSEPVMKGPDNIDDIVNDVEGMDRLQGVEATNSDDDVSTVRSIDINGNKKKRGGRRKKKKDDGPGITVNL